jgi:hypothetical protein
MPRPHIGGLLNLEGRTSAVYGARYGPFRCRGTFLPKRFWMATCITAIWTILRRAIPDWVAATCFTTAARSGTRCPSIGKLCSASIISPMATLFLEPNATVWALARATPVSTITACASATRSEWCFFAFEPQSRLTKPSFAEPLVDKGSDGTRYFAATRQTARADGGVGSRTASCLVHGRSVLPPRPAMTADIKTGAADALPGTECCRAASLNRRDGSPLVLAHTMTVPRSCALIS